MGALMSHMEEDIRCSLVISILEQLCSDGDAEVRHAALVSLISVLNFMSGLDKYRVVSKIFYGPVWIFLLPFQMEQNSSTQVEYCVSSMKSC